MPDKELENPIVLTSVQSRHRKERRLSCRRTTEAFAARIYRLKWSVASDPRAIQRKDGGVEVPSFV
jgi:hypothetical protein